MKKLSTLTICGLLALGITTSSVAQSSHDISIPTGTEVTFKPLEAPSGDSAQGSRDTGLPADWEGLSLLSEDDTDGIVGEGLLKTLGKLAWAGISAYNVWTGKTLVNLPKKVSPPSIIRLAPSGKKAGKKKG